jgi:S1-C subfamily serine protease
MNQPAKNQLSVQIMAVAMLIRTEAGPDRYLGTCFAFRQRHVFLTARHNVGSLTAEQLTVLSQGGRGFHVREVRRHPKIDLAALIGDPAEGGLPVMFSGLHVFDAAYGLGEDAAAFGFPVGAATLQEESSVPTPRLFRGHVQRLARYASGGSEPYIACEMSFPSTGGLSGGPVFVPGTDEVFALITGNDEAYTIRDQETVERAGGATHTVENRRIVSYGMALALWFDPEWLKDVVPPSGSRLW